jgi:hypothetical protein
MTKATPNKTLENFVTTNKIRVRVEGWAKRVIKKGRKRMCFGKRRVASVGSK